MSVVNKSGTSEPEFTGWRAALWPIHGHEMKKFLPLGLIMFCLLFNYTVLRDTKDTLVVNSAGAGAITFLKLYCVTPAAILFVLIYAKLTNVMSRENVFYAVVTPFILFFSAFGFLIYPNIASLHPSPESITALQTAYPHLSGFIDIYAYWAYSLFYVLAEIWGSAMIALMFWQFANHVVRMRESKRFYGLFAVIGNVALIFSGQVVVFCSKGIQRYFSSEEQAWVWSIYLLMGIVAIFGVVCMGLYRWMHTNVLNDVRYFNPAEQAPKKKKEKPSLMESAKMVFTSSELFLIFILIMAYGVTINLVEVQFKHQLKLFYEGDKTGAGYNAFMGQFSTLTGLLTIIFGLTVGSNVLRRVSWFSAAVITPLFITLGGAAFFIFILSKDILSFILNLVQTGPVAAATLLGAGIVIFSKAIKYILFDSTKEMAYIPLDDELKTKGKAAVDVIGGRMGKAGGAAVQNFLLLAFVTKDVTAIAPQTFGVFMVICVAWLFAVKMLSTKVNAATKRRQEELAAAAVAA